MNIEKVKNYNQKLLAITGTLAIIFITIAIILIIGVFIKELVTDYDYTEETTGILSEEKIEKLQKENKREQLISLESARLIDTLNLIYAIPVSHKTLNKPEEIDDEGILGVLNSTNTRYDSKFDKRYSRRNYGSYNNLLIYNHKLKTVKKLFDKRINFKRIDIEYFEDDILILLNIASQDTFKDGVINLEDYSSLFIYSVKNKKTREISKKESTISHYEFIEDSKNLIIYLGIDNNKNGKFDSSNEPSSLELYDYETNTSSKIIEDKILIDLQKKLEGSD